MQPINKRPMPVMLLGGKVFTGTPTEWLKEVTGYGKRKANPDEIGIDGYVINDIGNDEDYDIPPEVCKSTIATPPPPQKPMPWNQPASVTMSQIDKFRSRYGGR